MEFRFYAYPGPLFIVYTMHFFLCVGLSFLELIRYSYLAPSRSERTQSLGLLIATGVGFLGGCLTFFPVYGVTVPQHAVFLMPLYPFIMMYFLAKHKLLDVDDMAEKSQRDKLMAMGILSASINHELRNPLYIIKSKAEVWLEWEKTGHFPNSDAARQRAREEFSSTHAQAERALQIVSRLTRFARRRLDDRPDLKAASLEEICEDLFSLIRYEIANQNIELVRDLASDAVQVTTDRGYLEEILFNLVVNAVQALKQKNEGGKIIVRSTSESGKIKIEVEDNGPGIPAKDLKKIFDPFYSTKKEGTGLGLYITQRLAEKISAKITAVSQPGHGACFTLELPGIGR